MHLQVVVMMCNLLATVLATLTVTAVGKMVCTVSDSDCSRLLLTSSALVH